MLGLSIALRRQCRPYTRTQRIRIRVWVAVRNEGRASAVARRFASNPRNRSRSDRAASRRRDAVQAIRCPGVIQRVERRSSAIPCAGMGAGRRLPSRPHPRSSDAERAAASRLPKFDHFIMTLSRLTAVDKSCAAGSACRGRSGAAVAANELHATSRELQQPGRRGARHQYDDLTYDEFPS